jgi:hypothetical protein
MLLVALNRGQLWHNRVVEMPWSVFKKYYSYIHCATNRKVAGSIPDGVTGIFQWLNPSGRIVALVSTQPLTEMVPEILPGGKDGRYVGLTTLPPSCADCLEILEPQSAGTTRACPGL